MSAVISHVIMHWAFRQTRRTRQPPGEQQQQLEVDACCLLPTPAAAAG